MYRSRSARAEEHWSSDLPRRSLAIAALALSLPVAAFITLQHFPAWDIVFGSHAWHFVIVSAVSAIALGLALVVANTARNLPDARTFFLAMGFVSMAGIFLAHGLGTAPFLEGQRAGHASGTAPASNAGYLMASYGYDAGYAGGDYGAGSAGTSDGGYAAPTGHTGHSAPAGQPLTRPGVPTDVARLQVVGFSAQLSLVVSALFFALSVAGIGNRLTDFIVRRWSHCALGVMGAIGAYVAVAIAAPTALLWIPLSSRTLNWTAAEIAWVCLVFACWRYVQAYRLSLLPLQGTMALAMALLVEAQLFMIEGPAWHLSWWEYHVVMLAGFLGPVLGLLWQYRSTGDLGAVVEGLFLREAVTGIRDGDPRALAALGAAVAAKDGETSAHVDRVSRLAVAIGEELGLPEGRLEVLHWAGRLHDVGKIGVPNSILLKPGRLTESEFRLMQRHSARGWQVAHRSGVLAQAAAAIRGHHERWNGSGYPDGLVGEQIPLEARIVAAADVWDALTARRPYRAALSRDEATAIIRRDAGVLLDPRCVEAMFTILGRQERGTVPATSSVS